MLRIAFECKEVGINDCSRSRPRNFLGERESNLTPTSDCGAF